MSSRFDYIEWDKISSQSAAALKLLCRDLESGIYGLGESRETEQAIIKLEECFMWIGKAIRTEQIFREKNLR